MSSRDLRKLRTSGAGALDAGLIATPHELRRELAGIIGHKRDPLTNQLNTEFIKQLLAFYKSPRNILPEAFILKLLDYSTQNFKNLPNVLNVSRRTERKSGKRAGTLSIVGDTHGQFDDVVLIFESPELGGYPSAKNQFIFNGDMVDRGPKGLEIMVVLLVCKLLCPESMHILRGNHECRYATELYGFMKEVDEKYSREVYDSFMTFFDTLPLAAVVEDAIFLTHGGIGPNMRLMRVDDINDLNRFQEIPDEGPIQNLLWIGTEMLFCVVIFEHCL